jgi:hypothetical protein
MAPTDSRTAPAASQMTLPLNSLSKTWLRGRYGEP